MYLQKWFHDKYMVLNSGKAFYMTFDLNTTKNEFVFEDDTKRLQIKNYEAIMQKGSK